MLTGARNPVLCPIHVCRQIPEVPAGDDGVHELTKLFSLDCGIPSYPIFYS